jgi:cysteine desulfuration protein SufE
MTGATTLQEIVENFSFLDDWDDKYRYLIELGRTLPNLPEADRTEDNKVRGCASQVWLATQVAQEDGAPVLHFAADSDAHIVKGLVALALALFTGKKASDILAADAQALFDQLDLSSHLSAQRANGLRAMVDRIKRDAQAALAQS